MTSVSESIADSIGEVASGSGIQASEMMNINSLLNNFSKYKYECSGPLGLLF